MRRLYGQLDHALKQKKETLQEVERVGGAFFGWTGAATTS